jgi:3-oxoacyl-[acyl-carrier-protein] synthase-3
MDRPVRAAITGMGAAVPDKVRNNEDFEKFLDTSDEWITQRTGIKQRHVVTDGQTTATLAAQAGRRALHQAGVRADQLDLIICATITPDMTCPATACFVQDELGATDVAAFDIGAACCGYVYGLAAASKFIETRTYRRALVIGAETLSRFSDYTDRRSCILFGDGAGAAVLEATEDPDRGILHTVMHADGAGWDYIHVPAGGSRTPASHETVDNHLHFLKMRGRDVYKFAVEKMKWLLGDWLAQCRLTAEDVDLVVPHQVNIRILRSAAERGNFPIEKVAINIDRYGNTSAASIPLAMDEAVRQGRIGPGSTVLLAAFGAGLTWAGLIVRL